MIGQQGFGAQRRALDVEDYIDIARRHLGWIFGPAFAALVVSVVGAFLYPDTYVSTATIRVNAQQVPTSYVTANINQQTQDRISSLAQSILSRSMLAALVNTNQLYPKELARKPIDDVVEDMRSDIKIGTVTPVAGQSGNSKSNFPAFTISFAYTDRFKAQKVVQQISGQFVDQNIRDRNRDSLMTNQLLKDNWDAAKKDLDNLETKLADFRMRNQGRLPDQMQGNMQQLTAAQTRLGALNDALSRSNQERVMLESSLAILNEQIKAARQPVTVEQATAAGVVQKNQRLEEAEREVRTTENLLTNLRERYKDTHPDVQRAATMLESAKKKRDALLKEDEQPKPAAPAATAKTIVTPQQAKEVRDMEASAKRTEAQITAKAVETEQIKKEIASLNAQMRTYESRMQGVPMSEKEYSELMRDRELAKQKFADLDEKMSKSMMAQQMEDRRQGETLDLLDQASLPLTPSKPNRLLVIGAGTGLGLFLGLVLAGVREVKDTSLKNLKDVRAYTQMPLLGSVPLLENDLVVKRRRRVSLLSWSVAFLAGIVIISGSIIYYFATRA